MAFCPACGNTVSEAADARFCARCGRDLTAPAVPGGADAPPAAPTPSPAPSVDPASASAPSVGPPPPPSAAPTVHVQVPQPPPGQPPFGQAPGQPYAPAGPSPAALFARRVFNGRWERAATAAAAPALGLLGLALLIAGWAGAELPRDVRVGGVARFRAAVALLVQGIGGSLHFTLRYTIDPDYIEDGADGTDSGDPSHGAYHSHLSVQIWTATVLWVVVLVVVLRALRRRYAAAGVAAGADEAVRVALLAGVAGLVLGLVGQPKLGISEVSTSPFLVALGAFLLTLVTSLLVLCRPALDAWLAPRPGIAAAFRALGTALSALLLTLFFAGIVVWLIAAAHYDDLTGWGLAGATLLLLNLGVSGLGLSWGAPFDVSEHLPRSDDSGSLGTSFHRSFGLSDLGHVWNGFEVTAVVAGGVACALAIGLLAAWRSRDRLEMYGVAVCYAALFAITVALSGISSSGYAGYLVSLPEGRTASVGTDAAEALAFGLLWALGGVVVGSYLWRALGGTLPPPTAHPGTPVPAVPGPYGPAPSAPSSAPGYGGAGAPPAGRPDVPPQAPPPPPQPIVHDLGVVQPDRLNKRPPSDR